MKPQPHRPIRPVCSFDAVGKPEPQGSTRGFMRAGRVQITSDNANLHYWRAIVAWSAREAMQGKTLVERPGEVYMHLTFRLARPLSLPKSRVHPVSRPDVDKLLRACLDGMTGVVYRDDSQTVGVRVNKRYCDPGEQPGVAIEVWAG